MNKIISIFAITLIGFTVFAKEQEPSMESSILHSYQKEMSFLNAYKIQVRKKIKNLKTQTQQELVEGQKELNRLEVEWLGLQSRGETLANQLREIELENEEGLDSKQGLDGILEQAQLNSENLEFDESTPFISRLEKSFDISLEQLARLQQVHSRKGSFFDENGTKVEGEVIYLGEVSRYGVSKEVSGLLYPVGNGAFRIWKEMPKKEITFIKEAKLTSLPIFIYESAQAAFTTPERKSLLATIQAGGTIAWVLVVMGIVAVILSVLRFVLLRKSQVSDDSTMSEILSHIERKDYDKALVVTERKPGAVFKVLGETIMCFKNNKENVVEDVIAENILRESLVIDRFGTILMIIASIATLLGLLGTVTGMINTFEMITEFGNTNPKMLSGGISEALITTKFGLIVAIPTILVGQILNSWNEKIKTQMEESALAVCNRVKNG